MQKTIVSIPKPCHEDWNAMRPEEQGRFCGACEKVVVDFTNKTPAQIKETLMQNTGKVCGRFKKSDLGRPLEEPVPVPVLIPVKTSWLRSKWLSAAAMVTAFFIGKKAQAQEEMLGNVVAHPEPPKQDRQLTRKPSSTVIHGQIKSLDAQKGLSQVEITVYSNGKEISRTFAFNSGYSITLPENTVMDYKVTLESSAIGFETTILQDVPVIKNTVALDLLMTPLTEEVMNTVYPVFYPPIYTVGEYYIDPPPPPPVDIVGLLEVDIDEVDSVPRMSPQKQEPEKQVVLKKEVEKEVKKGEKPAPTKVVVSFPEIFTVEAYPNPGNGIFQVNLRNRTGQTELFVYNLEGRMVLGKKTSADHEVLDITAQPNGVYIIKAVQTGTNKASQARVVKTN